MRFIFKNDILGMALVTQSISSIITWETEIPIPYEYCHEMEGDPVDASELWRLNDN